MRSADADTRGVYEMECLSPEGFPLIIALTSDNRKVAERVVYPFEDRQRVVDETRVRLDRLDPLEAWKRGDHD